MKRDTTALVTFLYDALGNLTSQRDGRNLWLYFEYDALDRLVKKRQDSAAGPVIAEYLFDVTGQKGLLSRSKLIPPRAQLRSTAYPTTPAAV